MGDSEITARHATDAQFLEFAASLVSLDGANLQHWTVEERRDFLNWCVENGILRIDGHKLMPATGDESASQAV